MRLNKNAGNFCIWANADAKDGCSSKRFSTTDKQLLMPNASSSLPSENKIGIFFWRELDLKGSKTFDIQTVAARVKGSQPSRPNMRITTPTTPEYIQTKKGTRQCTGVYTLFKAAQQINHHLWKLPVYLQKGISPPCGQTK